MMALAGLLLLAPMGGFAVETTAIQGTVYRADGTVAQGTMLVSWPAFTAADGSTIAAGTTTATIAPDGSVNLALTPNAGANPAGTYYTVVYHMNDGTVVKEYWVVPQTATAAISQLRAQVVPAAVAQQTVSQQYVDASVGGLQAAVAASYLQLKGGTMSGALKLSSDPVDPLGAATKEYVDAHAGSQLPQAQNVIAGRGDGGAVSLAEKGVTVSGANGTVAWDEDLNAGIYDPRDPRWAGGINGATPAAAAQAMSNQMACDLATDKVKHAVAKWPQGVYFVDELTIAPGSSWEGAASSTGGTTWQTEYSNHPIATAPNSMTVTCSDGQQHTDSLAGTRVSHFTLEGCAQGSCTNAPGDNTNYAPGGGPNNTGLEMTSSSGIVEYVTANAFGGYGIRVDGQDAKAFHLDGGATGGNLEYYYYGGYKGYGESLPGSEVSATTTGSTGSVALSWAAVTGANAYAVYRGTGAGNENLFYITTTNSYTDTGAMGNSGSLNNVATNTVGAPGTVTATPSSTGGTLAAGTYYYRVSSLTSDGWHGSVELVGVDVMADWIEQYGLFDLPTTFTYHHLADILSGGGYSHFDHLWPQLGQVGIANPYGLGVQNVYENFRVDFARLEGIFDTAGGDQYDNGIIMGSCGASNAQTINTGQEGARFAGTCVQFFSTGGAHLGDTVFAAPGGFGPYYTTADILNESGRTWNTGSAAFQFIPGEGVMGGAYWEPQNQALTGVTIDPTYGTTSIAGLSYIYFTETSPASTWGFQNARAGQDFYVQGGNSNVTLTNNPNLLTCTGQNINLGNVAGYLHFYVTNSSSYQGYSAAHVAEICNSNSVTNSETVTYSATPAFSTATRASMVTLTGNVTSFTLGAGADGQEKTLEFCQNSTGGFTVAAPVNVHGFMTVGTTASKCSAQHFTYSGGQAAWLADSPGVVNE